MRYFMDTNIVLRAVSPTDTQHRLCIRAINRLRDRGHTLVTSTQVAAELWNTLTRSKDASPVGNYGLSIAEATSRLEVAETLVAFIDDPTNLYMTWRQLVMSYAVIGTQVHDARHAAWMIAHKVEHMITFNVTHFKRFHEISAISPNDV
jgi:predicted nucleic acid-binding protein